MNTIIPKSVTAIAPFAFSYIRSLTSITIPEGVTSIGDNAFRECKGLTSITIPSTIAGIGIAAFSECESLTSIDLPDGLASIGDWAFNLSGLTSVTIPDGVNSIGANAFFGCKLNTVVLGANIKNIVDEAFRCPRLKVVKCYAEDVPNVGNNAFETGKMRALIVPEKSIEKYKTTSPWNEFEMIIAIEAIDESNIIFADATVKSRCVAKWDIDGDGELSRLEAALVETIVTEFQNSNITSFDELQYFTGLSQLYRGFEGCRNLTSISIPKNVTLIERLAFLGCGNLTSINIDSGNAVYDSREDCNAIIETATNTLLLGCKGTIIPNTVTSIGESAFSSCIGLTSIIIPNGVTSIDDYAFFNCMDLSSVTMSSSVSRIGVSAFSQSGLTSIVIPDGVTVIAESTFFNCTKLTAVKMGNNVTNIEPEAFNQCFALTSINIPESVTSIGRLAFQHCTKLKNVYCHAENVPTTQENVFSNVITSATLHVPETSVEDYQSTAPWNQFKKIVAIGHELDNCIIFTDAKVKAICVSRWDTDGDGELSMDEAAAVTNIEGVFTYSNITSFNELQYFIGLTELKRSVFSDCSSLTSVIIPESVTSIGEFAFSHCNSLTSITIPDNVLYLGNYAFEYCSGVTSIIIAEGVRSIGFCAFTGCSGLTSLTIPSSVTEIGAQSFTYCSGLTDVYCYAENLPKASYETFFESPIENATLHVPAIAIEAYRTTAPWSSFGSIVPLKGDGVRNVDVHVKDDVAPWRTLDGRTLSGKPATKGIFIRNGKKMLVK